MRIVGFVVLAFAATFVATFAVVFFGTITYWDLAGIHDRDGGGAMGLFFVISPAIATLAAVIAAIVTAVRMNGRNADVAAGKRPPVQRWPLRVRAVVAAVAWAAAVYGAFAFVYWLMEPMYFASYAIAIVVAWLPIVAALAAAALAAVFVLRRRAPREV
jgi:hypothetical protein